MESRSKQVANIQSFRNRRSYRNRTRRLGYIRSFFASYEGARLAQGRIASPFRSSTPAALRRPAAMLVALPPCRRGRPVLVGIHDPHAVRTIYARDGGREGGPLAGVAAAGNYALRSRCTKLFMLRAASSSLTSLVSRTFTNFSSIQSPPSWRRSLRGALRVSLRPILDGREPRAI
jgi:hypothetical protein